MYKDLTHQLRCSYGDGMGMRYRKRWGENKAKSERGGGSKHVEVESGMRVSFL